MMRVNRAMVAVLGGINPSGLLNASLREVAEKGFNFNDGCCTLVGICEATNAKLVNFSDKTGYECFLNSIHIEDYDEEFSVEQSILFVKKVFDEWREKKFHVPLVAIVSVDDLSVVVRFHIKRDLESWLDGDIENYDDPILEMDSSSS